MPVCAGAMSSLRPPAPAVVISDPGGGDGGMASFAGDVSVGERPPGLRKISSCEGQLCSGVRAQLMSAVAVNPCWWCWGPCWTRQTASWMRTGAAHRLQARWTLYCCR